MKCSSAHIALRTGSAAAIVLLAGTSSLAQDIPFRISGGYSFAETFDMASDDGSVVATAGRLTGSWRFEFEGGALESGPAHLDAATLFRSTPGQQDLSGIMRFAMHEITGESEGSAWLYLRYDATRAEFEGTRVTFVVEGDFVGGTGPYAGATGTLRVTSVNGSDTGGGTIVLDTDGNGKTP